MRDRVKIPDNPYQLVYHFRVITGLRFVKKNRVIHLQIQEGELLPRLAINASSVAWKPVEDYKITDRKIFNGQDYHTLTWEKRRIDLDDLEAEDGHVLTGEPNTRNRIKLSLKKIFRGALQGNRVAFKL